MPISLFWMLSKSSDSIVAPSQVRVITCHQSAWKATRQIPPDNFVVHAFRPPLGPFAERDSTFYPPPKELGIDHGGYIQFVGSRSKAIARQPSCSRPEACISLVSGRAASVVSRPAGSRKSRL